MMNSIPENTTFTPNESLQKTQPRSMNDAGGKTVLHRCTVCGKVITCYYPNTLPGFVLARCSNGHKIKIRKEDFLRKAV